MTGLSDAAPVTPVAPDVGSSELRPSDPRLRIAVLGATTGTVLLVLHRPLSSVLAWLLPARAQISSSGTRIESFTSVAPQIIVRSGLVLLIVAAIAAVGWRWPTWHVPMTRRRSFLTLAALSGATAVLYGWLSTPHNGFSTNARFHWVDYVTWDSDNFAYAAGRIPHLLFYEHPHVWQAINVGIVVCLCFVMGRQLGCSRGVSIALAVVPAVGGNLLLFASAAEDVMLNTALLLIVIVASLHRHPVLIGLALGVATFGRPSFIILLACFVAAELATSVRRGTGVRGSDWRYVGLGGGVGLSVVVIGQVVFSVLGERYLFVEGQIVRQDALTQWTPRSVEGFTISPFSGVYALHLLWVAPLVLIVGAVVAAVTTTGQITRVAAAIHLSAFFVVGHVLVHEARPLAYYNGRYLAYTIPFLFFMATTLLVHARFEKWRIAQAPALALLVLGTTVLPADPLNVKRFVEGRPETALLDSRHELRDVAADGYVFLDFGDVLSRNYLSYVLRRDIRTVQLVGDGEATLERAEKRSPDDRDLRNDVVISLSTDPWTSGAPTIEVGDFVIFVIER